MIFDFVLIPLLHMNTHLEIKSSLMAINIEFDDH